LLINSPAQRLAASETREFTMKKLLLIFFVLASAFWWFRESTIKVPSNDVSFGYVVKYSGHSTRHDTLPMLIALHGNGDTAKNFYETALDDISVPARIILLKGPISYGGGRAWPWSDADFAQYGKAVSQASELMADKYPTAGKPMLLGFSGGGMMAYYQAVNHGDTYSYIVAVSGQLPEARLGDEPTRPGAEVHAFHGKSDNVVALGGGKAAASLLQAKGVHVTLTEFAGGHLGIFTDMKSEITQTVDQQLERLR
jgi:predicted esterase